MSGQPRYGVPVTVDLRQLMADEPWRKRAACAGHRRLAPTAWDDALADGREEEKARLRRIGAAKAVCRNECPVRAECARDANPKTDAGVRGGVDLRADDAMEQLARIAPRKVAS